MNDLEERLRADLFAATSDVASELDLDRVMDAGGRVVRDRRIRRSLGGIAAAAAFALVAYAGFANRPMSGVPAPVSTTRPTPARTEATKPATSTDPLSTTFELSSEGFGGKGPAYESMTFTVVAHSGGSNDVRVTLAERGVPDVVRTFQVPVGSFWKSVWDEHLLIGALPDRTDNLSILSDSAKGVISKSEVLEGVGATVFWAWFEETDGPKKMTGALWQGMDGVMRNSLGEVVPSADVALSSQAFRVYRDAALDTIGIVASGDGGGEFSYSHRVSDTTAGEMVGGGMGRENDDGTVSWTRYGALPPGTHDLKVELADADGEWNSATMSDGWVAVVANSPHSADTGDVIRSITYTDANGKVVQHTP